MKLMKKLKTDFAFKAPLGGREDFAAGYTIYHFVFWSTTD